MTNTIKLILVAALLSGCATHLATLAPPEVAAPAGGTSASDVGVRSPEEQADRCERTSDAVWWMRTISGSMMVAAGAEGVGVVPVKDDKAEEALAVGAGITAGTAAVLGFWGQSLEQRYQRECTGE
jgi:hypothetical protein